MNINQLGAATCHMHFVLGTHNSRIVEKKIKIKIRIIRNYNNLNVCA